MRTLHASSVLVASLLVAACGSSSSSGPAPVNDAGGDTHPGDTSTSEVSSTDTGTPSEAGTDSGIGDGTTGDGASQDAGPPPPGTKIFTGAVNLFGPATDDGYVGWFGTTDGTVAVAPFDGSAAATVIDSTGNADALVSHKAVFSWALDPTGASGVGAIHVWTKASGVKALGTAGADQIAEASIDGTAVVYGDNGSTDGSKIDIMYASLAGGAPKTIAAGVSNDATTCAPFLTAGGGVIIVATCAVGSTDATIVSVDVKTGNTTPVATGAMAFPMVDQKGDKVFVITSAGAASIVTIGGASTAVDTAVSQGALSPDGGFAVYTTTGGVLKRSGVATPLVASGIGALISVRPDLGQVIYANDLTQTDLDLHLVSTAGGGAPIDLVTTTTGEIYGDAFTTDGNFALYFSAVTTDQTGAVQATPIAGGAARSLATNAWLLAAIGGSKVAYNDAWVAGAANGTADLYVVDLAKPDAPKSLVKAADAYIVGAPKSGQIAYSWSNDDQNAGVYVLTP